MEVKLGPKQLAALVLAAAGCWLLLGRGVPALPIPVAVDLPEIAAPSEPLRAPAERLRDTLKGHELAPDVCGLYYQMAALLEADTAGRMQTLAQFKAWHEQAIDVLLARGMSAPQIGERINDLLGRDVQAGVIDAERRRDLVARLRAIAWAAREASK